MTVPLSPAICAFLDAPDRYAVLGTANGDRTAHQAVTWFERRGQTIVVNGRIDRHWAVNARCTGRLSVAVVDGQDYVILRGRVDVIDDPAVGQADIQALARRYGDDTSQFAGQQRVTFVLRPERIALHGSLADED